MVRTAGLLLILALVLGLVPVSIAAELEESEVTAELFRLNLNLKGIQGEINQLDERIARLGLAAEDLASAVTDTQSRRRERQQQFRHRARFYSEQGPAAHLGLLLGANTLGEFLQRLDMLNQILAHDARMMRELRVLSGQLQAQVKAVEEQRIALREAREKHAAQQALLQQMIARKEEILSTLQEEQRPAVEEQLAQMEETWQATALPLLEQLGEALESLDPKSIRPDNIEVSLRPPGALVSVSEESLNRFIHQGETMESIAFRLRPDNVSLEGEFEGAPLLIKGRFLVAGRTAVRFEPITIVVDGVAIPGDVITEMVQSGRLDIDLSEMLRGMFINEIYMEEGQLGLQAGLW